MEGRHDTRPRKLARRLAVVWLTLHLSVPVAFAPLTGLIVCIGLDGHVDVEAAHGALPCHGGEGQVGMNDGCVDVHLGVGPMESSAPSKDAAHATFAAAGLASQPRPGVSLARRSRISGRGSPPARTSYSVVLLV